MTNSFEDITVDEFDNARTLQLQLMSDRPEVDAAVDAIFAECSTVSGIKREHARMKTCLKVVLLNLFKCHAADPSCYVRYSRRNVTLLKGCNQKCPLLCSLFEILFPVILKAPICS